MLREADGICVPPGVGQAEGPGGAACCQPASRSHSVSRSRTPQNHIGACEGVRSGKCD